MDVIYLSVDQVTELHAAAIERFGGTNGIRSLDLLESAVYQAQQSAFGEDAYPSIPEKAAAYGFFIAQNQPFLDGNKRAGANAMLAFLYLNGFALDQSDDQIADAFIQLGTHALTKEQFFAWVADYAHEAPGE
jgi:death-on-curing protein